jgi:hypothetical protein
LTTSVIPAGFVWKVKFTVCGSSCKLFVSFRPPESVVVSLSSR